MREYRPLRPENTLDGRDMIELRARWCDEWNDEWMMNIERRLNDEWLWKRVDRLLRPVNTLDGRDMIKLELRSCDECNDK